MTYSSTWMFVYHEYVYAVVSRYICVFVQVYLCICLKSDAFVYRCMSARLACMAFVLQRRVTEGARVHSMRPRAGKIHRGWQREKLELYLHCNYLFLLYLASICIYNRLWMWEKLAWSVLYLYIIIYCISVEFVPIECCLEGKLENCSCWLKAVAAKHWKIWNGIFVDTGNILFMYTYMCIVSYLNSGPIQWCCG